MKTILFALFLLVSTVSFSQEKATEVQVRKLIKIMNLEKTMQTTMNSMATMMAAQTKQQLSSSGISGGIEDTKFDKYMEYLKVETKELTRKMIDVDMVSIYAKHFTEAEIKQMIAFYETPTGKKLLDKTPQLSNEMMTLVSTKYMPEFRRKLTDKLKEL